MVNTGIRSWLIGGWMATVMVLVGGSVAVRADISTTALLVALGVAPAIVAMILARSAPSPSVAEILHSVETKDRRA